jgi:hypothetical protein
MFFENGWKIRPTLEVREFAIVGSLGADWRGRIARVSKC